MHKKEREKSHTKEKEKEQEKIESEKKVKKNSEVLALFWVFVLSCIVAYLNYVWDKFRPAT